ncbi:MAG: hypothetical protein ACRBFS_04080 [Aureispira sp.]
MKKLSLYLLLALLVNAFFACKNSKDPTPPNNLPAIDSTPKAPVFTERQVTGLPIVLVVRTTSAQAHERPDFAAPVVATYQKEDSLVFTNRATEQHSTQLLEGFTYQEPWLRIILPNQKMAWIYGAMVSFNAQTQPALAELVLYPRVTALFGADLAQQMGIYQKEVQNTSSLPGFHALYNRAQNIKDSLEWHFTNLLHSNPNTPETDFFWLNELLDGLLLHYIPEQKKYYLFRDLKRWQQISQETPAVEDDAFMEALLAAYPADSIAYYYYGWQLPLEDQSSCSLLGSNIHATALEKIATALDSASYFLPELQALQQAILDDITTSDRYWMPSEAIQEELDRILQKNYAFLDRGNRVALKTKRTFLSAPKEHDLVLNLFEGE